MSNLRYKARPRISSNATSEGRHLSVVNNSDKHPEAKNKVNRNFYQVKEAYEVVLNNFGL